MNKIKAGDVWAMDFSHLERELISRVEDSDDDLVMRIYHLLSESKRSELMIQKLARGQADIDRELRSILIRLVERDQVGGTG